MRETYAYESQAGNLHKTADACAAEDLTALSKPDGTDAEQIGMDQAMRLIKNRKKVIELLEAIDIPRTKPKNY
jgi:hypothetical protein